MKIGLYFGSFNPIHVGHQIIANTMVEHTDMEEVWLVVSPQNPFKADQHLLDDNARVELARLAVEDNPRLKVCDIELSMPRPSYTYRTLSHLSQTLPQHKFCLIMGSDNLERFHQWKNVEDIISEYEIYVFPRPGYPFGEWAQRPTIHCVDCPQMEISSSHIREEIAAGRSVRYLVDEKVRQLILERKYYYKD